MRSAMTSVGCSACVLLLLAALFSPTNARAGDTIRINGSGSGIEMMIPLIEAYRKMHPQVSIVVEKPLGSSGAVKALLAGALDLAVTGRPLSDEEQIHGVISRKYGKTPFVIVTSPDVPIRIISTQELEDIYSGKTVTWPNGNPIRVVLRPQQDTDTKILISISPGMEAAVTKGRQRRGLITAVSDTESNHIVSKTPGSIGTAGLTGIAVRKLPLNILALNGVTPSIKTLRNGTYPLAKGIHVAFTAKRPPAAEQFLEFMYSAKGRAIAERAGVLLADIGK